MRGGQQSFDRSGSLLGIGIAIETDCDCDTDSDPDNAARAALSGSHN